jgi:3-hydroxyisobutyrate dehydrogenase-like beta-hydroxyacid dehydrogenase
MAMTGAVQTIGFIGLGAMGGGMARNVVKKHHGPVLVFDLDAAAVAAVGGEMAGSVAALAGAADVICLSLPGGKQVASVCQEIAVHAKPGTVIIDLSTTSVAEARAVHAVLAAKGIDFADAPVARARAAAEAGTLSIMVGASEALFARIAPVLSHMGSDVNRCGEIGCGQVVKLINNALLFVHVAALAEMLVAGERAGVSNTDLLDVLSISSADSFALRNHGMKVMLPRDFPERAFPMDYVLKDLGYALELAREAGVDARLAKLASDYYRQGIEAGIGAEYFPAIIKLIEGEKK